MQGKKGKGKGGKASGKGVTPARQNQGDSRGASKGGSQGSTASRSMVGMMSSAKIEKNIEKLEVLMTKVLQGSKPSREYWTCLMCKDDRCFLSRKTCRACGAERGSQPPKPGQSSGKAPGEDGVKGTQPAFTPMAVDLCSGAVETVPPEQEVKELENLLKVLKASAPSAKKDLLVASLQEQLQTAKSKVLQARPLPNGSKQP